MRLVENTESWILQFEHGTIDMLMLDYRFGILVNDGTNHATATIATELSFIKKDSTILLLPESTYSLSPLISILHNPIEKIIVSREGFLKIILDPESSIEVKPHEKYEAWDIGFSLGFKMYCSPSGGVQFYGNPNYKIERIQD